MGRRKKTEEIVDQEPLSGYQDTSITGRKDETSAPSIHQKKGKPIDIRSAELVDQMFCNYKYKHTVGPNTTNSVATKSEVPVHHDLVAAFRKLDAHLALICEEVDVTLIGDINDIDHEPTAEKIQKFSVTKFVLDGNPDTLSVVLSGLKELSTGESIKLETPKIAVDAAYPFAVELSSTIDDCVIEVEEYMHGRKQADDLQLKMEFSTSDSLVEENL